MKINILSVMEGTKALPKIKMKNSILLIHASTNKGKVICV